MQELEGVERRTGVSSAVIGTLAALFVLVSLAGCGRRPSRSAAASGQVSSASNSGAGSTGSSEGAQPAAVATPVSQNLVGTYVIREVEDNGAIDMVDPEKEQVVIAFFPDGSYARSTRSKGEIIHSDGGTFTLGAGGKMTLSTTMENKNILDSAQSKNYRYQLSADASELRLWGSKGKVAVFKKVDDKSGQK